MESVRGFCVFGLLDVQLQDLEIKVLAPSVIDLH